MNRVVVPVADAGRAVRFYREMLGFHVRRSVSLHREAELEHEDTIITLRETRDRKQVRALLHLAFEVESVAQASVYLKKRGVIARRTRACPDVSAQVCITDPDGHLLILFEA